eukprot:4391021-Pyramimonas_sp.AAC.1
MTAQSTLCASRANIVDRCTSGSRLGFKCSSLKDAGRGSARWSTGGCDVRRFRHATSTSDARVAEPACSFHINQCQAGPIVKQQPVDE